MALRQSLSFGRRGSRCEDSPPTPGRVSPSSSSVSPAGRAGGVVAKVVRSASFSRRSRVVHDGTKTPSPASSSSSIDTHTLLADLKRPPVTTAASASMPPLRGALHKKHRHKRLSEWSARVIPARTLWYDGADRNSSLAGKRYFEVDEQFLLLCCYATRELQAGVPCLWPVWATGSLRSCPPPPCRPFAGEPPSVSRPSAHRVGASLSTRLVLVVLNSSPPPTVAPPSPTPLLAPLLRS